MANLAPLIGEAVGVERAQIEVNHDGLKHSVRIGEAIDFEVKDIVPFGVETGDPVRFSGMGHPAGSDLTMAEAQRSQINASASSTRARPGSRAPTSPGPLEPAIASPGLSLKAPRLGDGRAPDPKCCFPCKAPLLVQAGASAKGVFAAHLPHSHVSSCGLAQTSMPSVGAPSG